MSNNPYETGDIAGLAGARGSTRACSASSASRSRTAAQAAGLLRRTQRSRERHRAHRPRGHHRRRPAADPRRDRRRIGADAHPGALHHPAAARCGCRSRAAGPASPSRGRRWTGPGCATRHSRSPGPGAAAPGHMRKHHDRGNSSWVRAARVMPGQREVAGPKLLGAVEPPGDRRPARRRGGAQQAGEQAPCPQQHHGRPGRGLDEIIQAPCAGSHPSTEALSAGQVVVRRPARSPRFRRFAGGR